ncbi:N-glycosylase/DNA lyase [Pyrococcus kukulkanii]|uniref:N-glycosylase/DNA lyase n=1 Tax=Pyrococcus kukulkanii TaxID=1609559 RepID=UPI0035625E24
MTPGFEAKAAEVGRVLSKLPGEFWECLVHGEPELMFKDQYERYGFGKFVTLMTMLALNDYRLKGPAEKYYWPPLHEIISKNPVPENPEDLIPILEQFYLKEMAKTAKIKRLHKFLKSSLAKKLWNSTPDSVARNFKQIWHELAKTMSQRRDAKTIVFAMKVIGECLILAGRRDFDFTGIPIPVDSRVKNITQKILGKEVDEKDVRKFWELVLRNIEVEGVTMIQLDSLVWQVAGLESCEEIRKYFHEKCKVKPSQEIDEVIEYFCNLVGE